MRSQKGIAVVTLVSLFGLLHMVAPAIKGQANSSPGTVPVHMVVMVEPLNDSENTVPALQREDVQVRQGKNRLQVTDWIAARGDQAGLQLFILIDDTSDTSLGSQLGDLRDFINGQLPTTWIGIGYMRNTAVNIVQNFTTDHAQAAKSLRLPLGSLGASDSPYLSLMSLLKGWPENKLRRSVIMVTDGVDRLRDYSSPSGPMPADARTPAGSRRGVPPGSDFVRDYRTMPIISPDVDSASRMAQRYGVIVNSIYTRGVGHAGRNYFELNNGQNAMAKLADETGGESFYLGLQNPVSFKPYLDRLQLILNNQYFLAFRAIPGKKDGLQRVKISTEIPKVEIVSADNVWVPATAATPENSK
jgi:hypothetical protein